MAECSVGQCREKKKGNGGKKKELVRVRCVLCGFLIKRAKERGDREK